MTDETPQPDADEGIKVDPIDEDEGTVDEPIEDVTDDGDVEDEEPEEAP